MVDGSGSDDALSNLGNKNIIIDHYRKPGSGWSLIFYRGTTVIRFQWILSQPPIPTIFWNQRYRFDMVTVASGATAGIVHHNLICTSKGRAPRFCWCQHVYTPATPGHRRMLIFRNNVIYNWGSACNCQRRWRRYYNVIIINTNLPRLMVANVPSGTWLWILQISSFTLS